METGMNTPTQNSYIIYNFTLTVYSIAAMISAGGMTVTDGFMQCDQTGCEQLSHKVI